MATLSYSFCMALLHSLWQAALLWVVYIIADKSLQQKFTPLQKKNLLFVSLAIQTVLLILTFVIYYFKPAESFWAVISKGGFSSLVSPEWIMLFAPWFFTAYTFIISYRLTKSVYIWLLFKKQFKTGLVKPSVDLKLFTTAKQYHFGIKRKVQLWFSNTVNTPVTFGFLKPVIILPVALVNQLSLQQAETIILHELAHIKANDFLLNWFVIITETVFFFNPFIISVCNKIKLEREKYCDITVTAFDYSPLLYAETLLKAQTVKQLAPQLPAEGYRIAAVNKPNQLLNRIQFFINPANQLQQQKRRTVLPLFSVIIITITAAVLLLPVQPVNKKEVTAGEKQQELIPATTADKAVPVIVNNVLQQFTGGNINRVTAAVEKHQPVIEKKMKQPEPLIKEIEAGAVKLAETTDENFATPAALLENDAPRQIVVREEQSGSKNASIKVYHVIFKEGKWILQPQWKLAAKEMLHTGSRIDTTEPLLLEEEAFQD